jgi:hypothetical protein
VITKKKEQCASKLKRETKIGHKREGNREKTGKF